MNRKNLTQPLGIAATTLAILLVASAPQSIAQTADGITPSVESPCDDAGLTGKAWGLCNAYCEAMDCEYAFPHASGTACDKVLGGFENATNGALPPCLDAGTPGDVPADDDATCPCWTPDELLAAIVDDCNDLFANVCTTEDCYVECLDPFFSAFVAFGAGTAYCDSWTDTAVIMLEISEEEAEACRGSIETLPIDPVEPPLG